MPSKLHFLESQEAGFIDNTGHTVRLSIYWQEEKPKTGPSQARKTPALFTISWWSLLSWDLSSGSVFISAGNVKHIDND